MKKLNALALSALLIPALSLGSMAFAAEDDDLMEGNDQRSGDMRDDDQRDGEMRDDDQRAGDTHGDDQRLGDADGDDQRLGDTDGDEQAAGERYLSGKPTGGLHSDEIIGSTVKHRGSDEDVGEIQDLIIGDDGQIVGVVVTTGGFLGLGGQDVGLGWDHIEHTQEDDESVFYVDMEEDALREAPEYEKDQD